MPNALTTDRERELARQYAARYYAKRRTDPEFMAAMAAKMRRHYAAHRDEYLLRKYKQGAKRRATLAPAYARAMLAQALAKTGTPARPKLFLGCPELVEAWTMVIKCKRMFAAKTKKLKRKEPKK